MDNKLIGNEKNILFYNDEEGNTKVEVLLENEDVWLNADALSILFNIDRSGIVRHINNIYKDEELDENSTCAKIAHMGNDGKQVYNKKYYNHSGYPGGLRERTAREMQEKYPIEMVERAVKGMLPKNRLGRQMYKKLFVYTGSEHPHLAQKPEIMEVK